MEKFLVLIMGPQGSGKGTQGKILAEKLGYLYAEMGPTLQEYARENPNERDQILGFQKRGVLVPDKIVMRAIKYKFGGGTSIILDGVPRNEFQAKKIVELAKEYAFKLIAFYINLSDKEALKRLTARLVCPVDGFEPPYPQSLKKTLCDKCGARLIKRGDDTENIIKKRLEEYHQKTEPMMDFLKNKGVKIVKINGEKKIPEVEKEIALKAAEVGIK